MKQYPHPSFLIPHPSFLIPHPSFLIPHPSSLIPPSSPPGPFYIVILASCPRPCPTGEGSSNYIVRISAPLPREMGCGKGDNKSTDDD
jgi:hypothetical protein